MTQDPRLTIRNMCIIAHVDHGKCYGFGTPIRLSDGSTKQVQDVTTKDSVLGLDGKSKRVIEVHHGEGPLYKVKQDNGDEYVVNENHLLVLKFTNVEGIYWDPKRRYHKARYIQNLRVHDKCFQHDNSQPLDDDKKQALYVSAQRFLEEKSKEPGYKRIGDVIEISVKDYLALPKNIKTILYGFKQAVDFEPKTVSLEPYMVGLWLGDGTTAEPAITNVDPPIIDYINDFAERHNLRVTEKRKLLEDENGDKYEADCKTYYLAGNPKNAFRDSLKEYGLLGNKHIPKEYLYNTREVRLLVLAGLIDSDGYMYDNMYEISQKSDVLALDIVQLARSLGFSVSHYKREKTCVKKDGTRVTGLYNMVNISGENVSEIPAILDRKKTGPCRKPVDFLITRIHVAETEPGKYAGFQIEGDGQFFGVDYTVHHNSTMSDTMLMSGGLVSESDAGQKRMTDNRKDEIERGITIKSTGVSFTLPYEQKVYTINLIDSPGHVDFGPEVTAAIRVTDGAFVLVDCVEGVCVQTETVLRQALAEQVRPVLIINKLDRYFFELNLDPESAFLRLSQVIDKVNGLISTYQQTTEEYVLSPSNGNVFFTSGLHGWGFGLHTWAERFALKNKRDPKDYMKYLWGDYYLDTETKKITTKFANSDRTVRTFCQQVYKPIYDLIHQIMGYENLKEFDSNLEQKLTEMGIRLTSDQKNLRKKDLYKAIFKKWLPLADVLTYAVVEKLPSPVEAQKYRAGVLFAGPTDHEAYKAIAECDPKGPLMVYISKMFPSVGGQFLAFGRVFSGTCTQGQKITILGANYDHDADDKKNDLHEGKAVQRIVKMIGAKTESIVSVHAGEICAFIGIDAYLVKSGTLTTSSDPWPIRTMKFSVHPVVQVSVKVKDPSQIHKLTQGIKRLMQADPCVKCYMSESGEQIIAGTGELHLEICVNDLRDFMHGVDLIVSDPIVPFRETVTDKSYDVCLAKSPNKLNRLYLTAEPLPDKMVKDIESGTLDVKDVKIARKLADEYGWDINDAKKIWGFGLLQPTNVIVDTTKGLAYLNEVKDSIVSTFNTICDHGVLSGEPLRGVRFNLMDASLHTDSVHRGISQLGPASRRVLYASQMTAKPKLVEPYYQIQVQIPETQVGIIYSAISHKRGRIESQEQIIGTPLLIVKGFIPVLEAFSIDGFLKSKTSGQAFTQLAFSHWEQIQDDPLDTDSKACELLLSIRKRKGLKDQLPELSDYLDKL